MVGSQELVGFLTENSELAPHPDELQVTHEASARHLLLQPNEAAFDDLCEDLQSGPDTLSYWGPQDGFGSYPSHEYGSDVYVPDDEDAINLAEHYPYDNNEAAHVLHE